MGTQSSNGRKLITLLRAQIKIANKAMLKRSDLTLKMNRLFSNEEKEKYKVSDLLDKIAALPDGRMYQGLVNNLLNRHYLLTINNKKDADQDKADRKRNRTNRNVDRNAGKSSRHLRGRVANSNSLSHRHRKRRRKV